MKPRATLPPGPDFPPVDQARLWLERPTELLDGGAREFGDLFTLRLGAFGTIVIVAHPEAVRSIFLARMQEFECRHFNESYRFVMGENALFLQDGPAHQRLRRILAPLFRTERIASHAKEIVRIARKVTQGWSEVEPIHLRPLTHEIALRSLLCLTFGSSEASGEQVITWFRSVIWRDLRSWKPWTSLSRLHPQIRSLISAELDERRGRGPGHGERDLLDDLLAARDDAGQPLGEAEIQDQILMLTITAGDAIAVALAWALDWVAREPEVQQSVRAEIGGLGANPEPLELVEQPYLSATCQEVLRLNPVLPTVSGRRLTRPLSFQGFDLDAGVTLAPCEYLVHRRPDLYPEPLEFRPERFLKRRYAPHEYFPFGGGQRACLGSSLAPLTLKLVLATILERWVLTSADPSSPAVVRHGTLLALPEDRELRAFPWRDNAAAADAHPPALDNVAPCGSGTGAIPGIP